jgi:hypothetical protein
MLDAIVAVPLVQDLAALIPIGLRPIEDAHRALADQEEAHASVLEPLLVDLVPGLSVTGRVGVRVRAL